MGNRILSLTPEAFEVLDTFIGFHFDDEPGEYFSTKGYDDLSKEVENRKESGAEEELDLAIKILRSMVPPENADTFEQKIREEYEEYNRFLTIIP